MDTPVDLSLLRCHGIDYLHLLGTICEMIISPVRIQQGDYVIEHCKNMYGSQVQKPQGNSKYGTLKMHIDLQYQKQQENEKVNTFHITLIFRQT